MSLVVIGLYLAILTMGCGRNACHFPTFSTNRIRYKLITKIWPCNTMQMKIENRSIRPSKSTSNAMFPSRRPLTPSPHFPPSRFSPQANISCTHSVKCYSGPNCPRTRKCCWWPPLPPPPRPWWVPMPILKMPSWGARRGRPPVATAIPNSPNSMRQHQPESTSPPVQSPPWVDANNNNNQCRLPSENHRRSHPGNSTTKRCR